MGSGHEASKDEDIIRSAVTYALLYAANSTYKRLATLLAANSRILLNDELA